MAVIPGLPGLRVTVEVAGEALPEHDNDTTDTGHAYLQHRTKKYIEAPAGEAFEIRTLYQAPFDPPLPIHVEVMLDGNYVLAPYFERGGKDGCEGYKYGKAMFMAEGEVETRNFCFSALTIEERDDPVTEETKRKISCIGQITVYLYYIERLDEARSTAIPRALFDSDEALTHKAMKAAVSQGDSLTCQTSLSAPEKQADVTCNEVKTTDDAPFAAFTFFYRSTAALKSLGIIARTPSPSQEPEPEPKDIESMNKEELMAELLRMRKAQDQAARIKRERQEEREDSAVTIGGEDDEVEWIGSQPSKRQRRSPGEDDEVVDLED
ncbi:hypothetical protein HBH46_051030 [Parastagonospora nodorum]|nr:hypothetical protein HBH46_051030 [Parastagonospora nodorum]KAH4847981.1 hypothetical protein HBH75_156960 [Parastagonospora nodorum]KAH5384027.1 hypothetical protein HBI33_110140 [Parastagonospora nodorum]